MSSVPTHGCTTLPSTQLEQNDSTSDTLTEKQLISANQS